MGSNNSQLKKQAYMVKNDNYIPPEVYNIDPNRRPEAEQPIQKTDEEIQEEKKREEDIKKASQEVDDAFDELIKAMNELDKGLEKFNEEIKGNRQDEDA